MADIQTAPTPEPAHHKSEFMLPASGVATPSATLHFYLSAVVLINLLVLFFDGHGGDLGFWADWMKQLAGKGYADFNGNYPPLYVHWLWLAGKLYNVLGMQFEVTIFLKLVTQIPVLISHMLLTALVYQLLKRYAQSNFHLHSAMLLTAFNPALLLDGPIWGQIDVVPAVPMLCALIAGCSHRFRILMLPLYVFSLLIKFQMIAVAPVIGFLFLRHIKTHLVGGLIAVVILLVAFLPAFLSGNAIKAFELAYLDVVHQYGRTTKGAANIWILLTGNDVPDTVMLFGFSPDSWLAPLFSARRFGIVLFVLLTLVLFSAAVLRWIKGRLPADQFGTLQFILFYAVISAVAFFTLLPAMHERYLMPAVIVSLACYAVSPKKLVYTLAVTAVATFNLLMTLGIKTFYMWPAISWAMLAILLFLLFEFIASSRVMQRLKGAVQKSFCVPAFSIWVLCCTLAWTGYLTYQHSYLHDVQLTANQQLLLDYPPVLQKQEYGTLHINKSVHGNTLSVGKRRYAKGLGTHVNSVIDFNLPPGVSSLSFIAGVDNEVESTQVRFEVFGNGKLLWSSPIHYGSERNLTPVSIELRDINHISLRAIGVSGISGGHVDWVNPVLTFDNL